MSKMRPRASGTAKTCKPVRLYCTKTATMRTPEKFRN